MATMSIRQGWLAAFVIALFAASPALAQAPWPSGPVRVVVPYAAGGPTDIMARMVGQHLAERLGQPFVVENRTGAGGNIGTEYVARAAPDGQTLLVITAAQTINVTLYRNVNYSVERDFAPVALLVRAPLLLVANAGSPARSVADMLALARSRPGDVAYASASVGASPHLAMELLQQRSGARMLHVPYRGAAPAMAAVLAGDVPFMLDSMLTGLQAMRAGRIRALAVSSLQRTELAPEVPAIAETPGLEGFEAYTWYGLSAPAGTPSAVLQRLNTEVDAILKLPEVHRRVLDLGGEPGDMSTEAFGAFLRSETAQWGEIVRRSGATVE
jgi:tripartite-type tricarboxylate transporter receptor subunit TctC